MIALTVEPIGIVRGSPADGEQAIEVYPEHAAGLHRIEELDELWVLYWLHELDDEHRQAYQTYPRGDRSRPLYGVFALHSPHRPNPIGLTRVKLIARQGNQLIVSGLDAHNGSPVLDIKGEPPAAR